MKTITFDYSKALATIQSDDIDQISKEIKEAHDKLTNKTGAGSDFLGWLDLPETYDRDEFARIKEAAAKIQKQAEVLVVIGIGGSYLGAKAAIDFLSTRFYNLKSDAERKTPQIFFAGTSSSPTYLMELYNLVKDKELCLNVISKSGTTTEPAIAFRIFKKLMEEKYGKDGACKRIFVTTDKARGALKKLSNREGYETFVVPDNVGGRYSVLSAVGLLPIAVSGADIDEMMHGAQDACKLYASPDFDKNECYQYAGIRNLLYRQGKTMEIMANYEPRLHYVSEWWKQLYAESEGKDKKGIFTAAMDFSTDLHSMGQYVQDGLRNLYETVLHVEDTTVSMCIPEDPDNVDGLDYLVGKPLSVVNDKAFLGATMAHYDGGVPVMIINIPELSAYCFGQLVYFFERACGISGYLLGVNPFDQPGVEAYKKNMFALLGKPGYEEEKKVLEERLK